MGHSFGTLAKPRPPLKANIERVIRAIPRGQVMSYGAVAAAAGNPGAARLVVRVLNLAENLPWWRVVRSGMTLAPMVAGEQARLLGQEGWRVQGRRLLAKSRPKVK